MSSHRKMGMTLSLPAALFAALLGGMLTVVPVRAQSVPPVPGIGPAIAGCAVVAGLSPCLGPAVSIAPIVVIPGFGGTRNVDVDRDVDRHRTPGRVVIVE